MAVVISHIGNVAVLSSGKNGLFLTIFFSRFFLHLAVVLLFLGSHILGKGMFSKRRLFIYFCFVFFFERKFLLSLFFCKKYNQKLGGEKEIRDREKNGKMILNCRKKCLSLKLILYLAKIFDFEFQHHDHQTSL